MLARPVADRSAQLAAEAIQADLRVAIRGVISDRAPACVRRSLGVLCQTSDPSKQFGPGTANLHVTAVMITIYPCNSLCRSELVVRVDFGYLHAAGSSPTGRDVTIDPPIDTLQGRRTGWRASG